MFSKFNYQKALDFTILLSLLTFYFLINVSLISPKDMVHPLIEINFSISDLLIGIALILWVIKIQLYKVKQKIIWPPLPICIFILIGAFSFGNAFSKIGWIKQFIQWFEYLFIFFILLSNNLNNIKLCTIKRIIFIPATAIVLIAFIQQSILNSSVYLVRGVFENRNILGSYLCIVIPLMYADLLVSRTLYRKIWLSLTIGISILILTSANALLSIFIGLLIISILHSKKVFYKFMVVAILTAIAYPFLLPKKNLAEIKEFCSIYESGKINENYYKQLTILYDLKKPILLDKKVKENSLVITSNLYMPSTLPEIRKGERYKELDYKKNLKQRYVEMQVALKLLAENTLLGVGLGNYQGNIGTFYEELPKVNTAEPNQLSGYLIIGVISGILGLAAYFWILIYSFKTAHSNYRLLSRESVKSSLYLGLIGTISACFVESFFSFLLVAGLIVPFVLIIYLSTSEHSFHE